MTPARFAIRLTFLFVATSATIVPLAAQAVTTRARAPDAADPTSLSLAGDPRLAGDSGSVLNAYFAPFTLDDAVLHDDGQPLAAAVRALAFQISGEYVAAYPRRGVDDLTLAGRARGADLKVASGRLIDNPSTGLHGHGYLGIIRNEPGFRDLRRGVLVAEPPTASIIAIGLGMLLMGLRRRAAERLRS